MSNQAKQAPTHVEQDSPSLTATSRAAPALSLSRESGEDGNGKVPALRPTSKGSRHDSLQAAMMANLRMNRCSKVRFNGISVAEELGMISSGKKRRFQRRNSKTARMMFSPQRFNTPLVPSSSSVQRFKTPSVPSSSSDQSKEPLWDPLTYREVKTARDMFDMVGEHQPHDELE